MAPNKTSEHLAQNHQLSERKIFPKKGNNQNKPQEIVTRPSHAGQAKQFKFNFILYSKNPVSDFFLDPSQPNNFFLKISIKLFFLGKKPYPPLFRLNDRSLNAKQIS